MVVCGTAVKGQTQTYANSEENGKTGLCVICGVTNPTFPINSSSLTDYSNFVVTVGLGGVTVYQTLIFPSVNPNVGCDEIIIRIGSGATLLTANLLGGVTVQSYNGNTANPDAVVVNSSILTLLGTDNQGEIRIKPTASFDRVRLTLSSALLGALSNFRVYFAYSLTGKPVVAATTGAAAVCVNSSTGLSNTSSGGVWSSVSPAIATVNAAGLVTGVSAGSTTINYTVTNATTGCSTTVPHTITVNALPVVNAITGTLSACIGKTTTLSSTTTGGVWTSGTPGVASINPTSGLLTGVSAGTSLITYTVTNANGCVATQTATVTINALPVVNAITGTLSACIGKTTTLSSTTPGGVWTSGTPGVASINPTSGLVTGVSAGTSLITYTVTNANGCVATQTATVTINALPVVNAITGTLSACIGKTTTLSSTTTGGVWTSGTPGVASIDPTSGLLTGVSAGTALITYTVTNANGCVAIQTATVTINALPVVNAITGTLSACIGKTTTLSSTTTGGVWTSGTPAVASIDPSSGLVTGVSAGTTLITYTVTNGNGCVATQTATVTINALPVVNAITGTLSACIGKTTTLSSTTTGGVWTSGTPGVASIDPSSGLVTGVSAGTALITYTVTNGNGCVAAQTTTVTINALPIVNAITGTLSACIGATTSLSSTTPGGVWTSASPGVASIDPSSGLLTGVSAGTAVITYTVTNGNGCVATQTASVIVHTQPSIPAISQREICLGQSIDLSSLNPADVNGTTGGSYVWSSSIGGAALSSTTVSPSLGNTTYYLRYTKDGCFSDSSVLIVVHPKPPTPHVTLN
ncbi:beta strand repeat-containing protein [Pedobacter gandavensis]|uniref:beta strand repeat-containing protein n=1 Tax=Pedobacter gandavensis TaxID=2679963 RepID=UPI0029313E36|nr:Ig-like domain-containing protein [Pedobacter gandavensis]